MESEVVAIPGVHEGLPQGWRWLPLAEVADNLDNKRKPINAAERETRKGDVPYYGATGQVGWIDKHLLDEEVVLVGEDGAPFLEPGRPKAYMISGKSWVNNHAHILRARDGMPNAYLMHFLNILDYSPYVTGTTRLKLTKGAMNKIPVPVAPLPQQRRIVEAIELQLGRLDAAVARLHAAKAKLKRYRQAVLKAAVEGRLTDPSLSEGELPKGWKVVPVEEVGQIVTGRTPSKSIAAYYGTDHPFYKPTDLAAGYETSESNDGLSTAGLAEARELPAKSILVTCIGATIGKTGLIRVSGACNQQINAIVPNNSLVPEYGYFQCIAPFFQKQIKDNASATTLPLLNKNRFKVLDFILPPKVDQLKIVKEVEARLERTDEMGITLDAQLAQAVRLRQSVLKRVFEGRLV
jgi:type I restriction enzyme S subunit